MTFMPPISAPIVAPIATPGGAVVIPWYLLGGVTAAQCVAAYQPKGAASLAASYVNLNNPGTYDCTLGVAPTLSNGWVFNGSSQYLKTGITPSTNYSILIQFTGATGAGPLAGEAGAGGKGFAIYPQVGTAVYYYGAGEKGKSPAATSGNLGVVGYNAPATGYRNGNSDASIPTAVETAVEIYIGAVYAGGTTKYYGASTIVALSIYNITLSSTQVGLIAAAMELLSYTPVLSAVTALDAAIKISWTGSWAAEGYSVERSLTGQNNWSVIGTTTNTYYTDSTVTTGVTYDYRMRGYNATI